MPANNIITGSNLSLAWAKAVMHCMESPGGSVCPAIVRFPVNHNGHGLEVPAIRHGIDKELAVSRKNVVGQSIVETVASTIFPETVWMRAQGDRAKFYRTYESMIPILKRTPANRRGVYFQRLIAFPEVDQSTKNQLEFIIETWAAGNHRHSALQAGIFDPRFDHSNARQLGFPCLQQVVFHPMGTNGSEGLSVVAFYANQTLMEKAYGNYLGLFRLGRFMAEAMGLELKEVVCMASALKLSDSKGKKDCQELADLATQELSNAGE